MKPLFDVDAHFTQRNLLRGVATSRIELLHRLPVLVLEREDERLVDRCNIGLTNILLVKLMKAYVDLSCSAAINLIDTELN